MSHSLLYWKFLKNHLSSIESTMIDNVSVVPFMQQVRIQSPVESVSWLGFFCVLLIFNTRRHLYIFIIASKYSVGDINLKLF